MRTFIKSGQFWGTSSLRGQCRSLRELCIDKYFYVDLLRIPFYLIYIRTLQFENFIYMTVIVLIFSNCSSRLLNFNRDKLTCRYLGVLFCQEIIDVLFNIKDVFYHIFIATMTTTTVDLIWRDFNFMTKIQYQIFATTKSGASYIATPRATVMCPRTLVYVTRGLPYISKKSLIE